MRLARKKLCTIRLKQYCDALNAVEVTAKSWSTAPDYNASVLLTCIRNAGSSAKRQRTGSRSLSPATETAETGPGEASDDDTDTKNDPKRSRSGRAQRDRQEKGEAEPARQETTTNKRKGRTERRRGEGRQNTPHFILAIEHILTPSAESDLSEEMPLAAIKATQHKGAESPSKEGSPLSVQPPGTPPAAAGSSHKRGGRSNRKIKGKNQYTKNRDQETDGSPSRSMSRDVQKGEETTSGGKSSGGDHRARAKAGGPGKLTMLDMRRRVAAILEFISRTQVDLAAEGAPSSSSSGPATPQQGDSDAQANGSTGDAAQVNGDFPAVSGSKGFKELSCMEMMDVLTRDMVKWQNQFA